MTAHFRARNALAEIPTRMGNLRVSTPTNRNPPPEVVNIIDTSMDNINNFGTPTTSPDEIIIRQRGRRRILLHWSPDQKQSSPSTSQNTPTKNILSTSSVITSMTLRSSPRKRLLENFNHSAPEKFFSPKKTDTPIVSNSYEILHGSAKKLKFEESSIIQTSNTPLNLALKGLTNEQLINIIQGLVTEQPELEKKIRNNFVVPDLKPMEEEIIHKKKNIFRSLPSSRLTNKTDSSAYSRAAIHLTEFKKTVLEHCSLLHESKHWDALLDYTMTIWYHVRATPVWDNFTHNAVRRQCFKTLAFYSTEALRYGGTALGEHRLNEFSYRIIDMSTDYDDINTCLKKFDFLLKRDQ